MLDFLGKKSREDKRKQSEENDLRASLAEKLAAYERTQDINLDDSSDDHTLLELNGKMVRVPKTQIDFS